VRVLQLSSLWPPKVLGGAELYAARLADRLRGRGHDVGAMTLGVDAPGVVGQLRAWPYSLEDFASQPSWKRLALLARDVHDPTAGRGIARVLEEFAPDVVHSHSVKGMSGAALAAVGRAGVPHVHHLHDYWLLCRRTTLVQEDGTRCEQICGPCRFIGGVRALEARRGALADICIAVAASVADRHRALPWLDVPMRVVHLPGAASAARPPRLGGAPVTFGFMGQVTAIKGISTLLAAFARLPAGAARLVVAGEGPLAASVAGVGADAGVEYRGWIGGADKDAFWAELDCLVVPSEWEEPGGTVSVEGRERGLPVLMAAIGGMQETLDARSRPLLFRSGDVDDLARALRLVVEDPERYRPEPGSGGPTWDDHVDQVEAVYAEAIALHTPHP
jgi:glycosyltransferase involved in cell wall biosynthesis